MKYLYFVLFFFTHTSLAITCEEKLQKLRDLKNTLYSTTLPLGSFSSSSFRRPDTEKPSACHETPLRVDEFHASASSQYSPIYGENNLIILQPSQNGLPQNSDVIPLTCTITIHNPSMSVTQSVRFEGEFFVEERASIEARSFENPLESCSTSQSSEWNSLNSAIQNRYQVLDAAKPRPPMISNESRDWFSLTPGQMVTIEIQNNAARLRAQFPGEQTHLQQTCRGYIKACENSNDGSHKSAVLFSTGMQTTLQKKHDSIQTLIEEFRISKGQSF